MPAPKYFRPLSISLPTRPDRQLRTDFTRYGLLNRAADYFAQARKPRAEWKKLDDLAAQLAEFDLHCAAGDFDAAANVLTDIDGDYLFLWGHYHLMIELHEKLQGKIKDLTLARMSIANLGSALNSIGKVKQAISNYEKALTMAREANNRQAEDAYLGRMGHSYHSLGNTQKAIECYEGQLAIARDIREKRDEGLALFGLGVCYFTLGNAHKASEYHELALVIAREVGDRLGEGATLGGLAACYEIMGQMDKAIEYQEKSLSISKEVGDRDGEGSSLSILGSYYSELDNQQQAKKYFEESLEIARQTGYRYGEGFRLLNLASVEFELGNYRRAIELALQSTKIGDEISIPDLQSNSYKGVSLGYLLSNDLPTAKHFIEEAQKFDLQKNYFDVSALHGIIALRQGERDTAQEAFTKSIAQADEILAKTPDYYSALDAKGLALSGLALCEVGVDGGPLRETEEGVKAAMETFRKARKIAPHTGVVKSVLRLFDELVKCDEEGVLKDVRKAVEGVG
jgi:tetratricopeptide (TPR) repeat protein